MKCVQKLMAELHDPQLELMLLRSCLLGAPKMNYLIRSVPPHQNVRISSTLHYITVEFGWERLACIWTVSISALHVTYTLQRSRGVQSCWCKHVCIYFFAPVHETPAGSNSWRSYRFRPFWNTLVRRIIYCSRWRKYVGQRCSISLAAPISLPRTISHINLRSMPPYFSSLFKITVSSR